MTGDPARDNEATPHDLNSPPSSDYVAEAEVRGAKQQARDQREAEQKARMDAAHEKAKTEHLRRPGARWRLLVHEMKGAVGVHSHYIAPNSEDMHPDPKYRTHHELPANTEFDELVVGWWLHIEQMDHATWWMNIGGLVVHVTADRDGRPTQVRADMEQEIDGCDYTGLLRAARERSEE